MKEAGSSEKLARGSQNTVPLLDVNKELDLDVNAEQN
jgi:hypothetical protein